MPRSSTWTLERERALLRALFMATGHLLNNEMKDQMVKSMRVHDPNAHWDQIRYANSPQLPARGSRLFPLLSLGCSLPCGWMVRHFLFWLVALLDNRRAAA